jgi:hypothetical protein
VPSNAPNKVDDRLNVGMRYHATANERVLHSALIGVSQDAEATITDLN